MQPGTLPTLGILAAATTLVLPLAADYPIASHRYLADPTTLVTKDRVYIYCSNDDESPVEGSYNIPNVICVSSSDMKNWTDHGSVFRAADATTWAKKTWAPAAIERDGKFFLYTTNGIAQLGHLDPFVRVEAETFNAQRGVETEPCSEGGMNRSQQRRLGADRRG